MKITSLNMRGFFDWDARLPLITEYLTAERPDVVLCQEVVFLPGVSPYAQIDLLNRALQYPHRHSSIARLQSSPEYGVYREGLAVLSTMPVVNSETLVLNREAGDPHIRLVQFFDLLAGEGPSEAVWQFANVHLSVRDDYAVHQLDEVLGILRNRGEQRILGGDFNVNHLERHRTLWRDDYTLTTEIEHYVSYAGSNQAEDYFLVPKSFTIDDIRLSPDGLSDHRAITVDVTPRVSPEVRAPRR